MRLASFRFLVLALLVFSFTGLRSGSGSAPARVQQVGLTIPNLMGYWALDETAIGTAADTSGNNNTGNHVNNPTISMTVAPVPVGNQRSLQFTAGSNQIVDVADSASLSITGSITLAAWINSNLTYPSTNQQGIIEKFDGPSPYFNGYYMRLTPNGYLSFNIVPAGGTPVGITTAPRVTGTTNTWVHVAGTYDSTTGAMTMYKDGVADATTGNSASPPGNGTSNLHLGADYGSNQFGGLIDEARVYSRALFAEEVNVLRTGQPPPTALVLTPTPGGINVAWTAPAAVVNVTVTYTVQQAPAAGGPWTTVASGIPFGTTNYTDTGLTFGQTYFYRVFAVSVMESVPLGPASSSPLSTVPRQPSDNDEGLWDDKCACGSSIPAAPQMLFGTAALAALLLLAFRRKC